MSDLSERPRPYSGAAKISVVTGASPFPASSPISPEPKSDTFTVPSSSIRKFGALRSLCSRPVSCISLRPLAACNIVSCVSACWAALGSTPLSTMPETDLPK